MAADTKEKTRPQRFYEEEESAFEFEELEEEEEEPAANTENVFCPTGEGGGIDPTCKPRQTVSSKGETLHGAVRDENTKKWKTLDGKEVPEHVRKAAIPPAWKDVYVNLDAGGTVIAKGTDAKGRTQIKYSASHTAQQAASKFKRVTELRQQREGIFNELEQDAKKPELRENAECLQLVMRTGMRPGSTKDTKADYQSFGATTLQGKHVRQRRGKVVISVVTGKSKGQKKDFPINDEGTAKMLLRRKEAAGNTGRLFKTNAGSLRQYSKGKDGGGFKTKDHRTALGTETAIAEIGKMRAPKNSREYKAALKKVATKVSDTLGNTPSVALKSYIDPNVFAGWSHAANVAPPKKRRRRRKKVST